MTRTLLFTVTLTALLAIAAGPLLAAQDTAATAPETSNSPAIPVPQQPAPQPLIGGAPPKAPEAPQAPKVPKPAPPHPDMTIPKDRQVHPTVRVRPQKPARPSGDIIPRAKGNNRLGSTENRRNQAVVLCNQQQISCKNRCTGNTMGKMPTMCAHQCASMFQECVNKANSQP